MKKKELEEILETGEGATVELKKSISTAIGREMSAFANTAGGRIFIGIDDKNRVQGCHLTNQAKSRIQDIANNCDPRVTVKIDSIRFKDKDVIVIRVPESPDKPVQCSEGFFLREGANSQKMTRDEILYWAQKTRKIRYEDQLRDDFNYPEDFNQTAFTSLMGKMNITVSHNTEDLLQNLSLGKDHGKFTINNAGIMLFGKKRDYYIRQVYVTCILYKGTDGVSIIDRKDFREGLVQDYENAMKFLKQHLRLEYVIEGFGPRKEIPEIPYEALKEALLNAIIHRDYFETGARVMVEVYDDRVEISNPGELLFEKNKIGQKNVSIARNPILFDIFNRMQLVEKAGTGIKRILAVTRSRGLNVHFETDSFFSVIFNRPGVSMEPRSAAGHVPGAYRTSWGERPGKLLEIAYPKPEEYQASSSIEVDRTSSKKADKYWAILEFCTQPKSLKEILAHMKLKHRESFLNGYLKPLLGDGLLECTIPDKPTSPSQRYITTAKGKCEFSRES